MSDEFVILRHSDFGPMHYDLMLRYGEALATWQLATDPRTIEPGQSVEAKRLPDHRLAYLTYEGPVSGGRGRVERVAQGTYSLADEQPGRWGVSFEGGTITGSYELRCTEEESSMWTCRRVS
ncbi:MAG: DNA polymerase ligase N-terminal domain-containing protein [Planctomycetota bacterium]|jgi:hypothetical protein